jgi:hypothetical protein
LGKERKSKYSFRISLSLALQKDVMRSIFVWPFRQGTNERDMKVRIPIKRRMVEILVQNHYI